MKDSMYKSCMGDKYGKKYAESSYCLCFEKNAKRIMTDNEYNYYKKDYSRYFGNVQQRINQRVAPPANDRV